jgi:hypothetical protein
VGPVLVAVVVPPGLERRLPGGHDDVGCRHLVAQQARQGGADQADLGPEPAHVDPAEPVPEHLDLAPRRVEVEAGDAQQGRLARPVGTEHDPALVGPDGPVDAVEDRRVAAHQPDAGHA